LRTTFVRSIYFFDPDGIALGEQGLGLFQELRVVGGEHRGGDQRDLALDQHGLHVGKPDFDDRIVALVLEPVPARQRFHADVDRSADGVGRQHLALQILDLLDRAILQHHELIAVVAMRAVLHAVEDDAQILHVGVLDGDADRRIGQIGEIEIARPERLQLLRRAGEMDRLQDVALAVMDGDALLGEHDRLERGRHHHPADAELERFRRLGGTHGQQRQRSQAGKNDTPHGLHPTSYLVFRQ